MLKNPSMLSDFYEFTMVAGYFAQGMADTPATFDLFIRALPSQRQYMVAAGLKQAIEFVEQFHFNAEDIEYILQQPAFKKYQKRKEFADYLKNLKFSGTLRAVPEGTLIFADEPIIEITAPMGEAQLIETALVSIIGHQTLIASKAARVVQAAHGKRVIDFGARRAHGLDAALYGSRACFIGGCGSTSNVLAGQLFRIPVSGTQAHSWIQSFSDERAAFDAYIETYPENAILLIDTYNIQQGAQHAADLNHRLLQSGKSPIVAVRIDSGDLLKNSQQVRKILDANGCSQIQIIVSSDLNEYNIKELLDNHAPIDSFGVGTEMMVSRDVPAMSIVYKLVEYDHLPRMKLSESKQTYPGQKQIFRKISPNKVWQDTLGIPTENLAGTSPLLQQYLPNQQQLAYPTLPQIQESVRQNLAEFREHKFQISAKIQQLITECNQHFHNSN